MKFELGTKLTIQQIEDCALGVREALGSKNEKLEVITNEPIEEIDLSGIQFLLSLEKTKGVALQVEIEKELQEYLFGLGFKLSFINQ